jgi:hypothetical protein
MQTLVERELELQPSDGSEPRKVTIRFGPPILDEDDWRVSIEIHGLSPEGQVFRKDAWGVDSAQALIEALWLAPVLLKSLAADTKGKLTFLGNNDLGFYRPPPPI